VDAGACPATYKEYHDQEWGPAFDATLFEFLILETFQGLSWITILKGEFQESVDNSTIK
jgi:3-methyladenine DNA glycosylase Tag